MLHLEGMGVMGCLTAIGLRDEGIKFTWSDTDTDRVSWRASTGAVLPFGDDESERDIIAWLTMIEQGKWAEYIGLYATRAVFCYVSTNPPHNAKRVGVEAVGAVGPVKVSNRYSLHFDVQTFVAGTRSRFRKRRTDGPNRRDQLVITHGFGENIYKWSWGWSAIVNAAFDPRIEDLCEDEGWGAALPMLYGRQGFQLPYLYPVGQTGRYYAGTTLITQAEPKSLPVRPKYETWRRHIHEYTDDLVNVVAVSPGTMQESWRPMAHPDAELIELPARRTIRIRPQYGNGIRRWPSTWAALQEAL